MILILEMIVKVVPDLMILTTDLVTILKVEILILELGILMEVKRQVPQTGEDKENLRNKELEIYIILLALMIQNVSVKDSTNQKTKNTIQICARHVSFTNSCKSNNTNGDLRRKIFVNHV